MLLFQLKIKSVLLIKDYISTLGFFKRQTIIPHSDKVYKGGEDAYFVNKNILIVVDGVGGWADSGVDPAIYSKKLCKMFN